MVRHIVDAAMDNFRGEDISVVGVKVQSCTERLFPWRWEVMRLHTAIKDSG